ncbi:MAG: hypothetical protein AAGF97_19635, partial [Planctomycetota bacterium]
MSAVADRVSVKRKKSRQSGNAAKFLSETSPQDDAYEAWGQYLMSRKSPRPLVKVLKSDSPPLGWGLEGLSTAEPTRALIADCWTLVGRGRSSRAEGSQLSRLAKKYAEAAEAWLAAEPSQPGVDEALTCLAWAEALPTLTGLLDAATWRQMYDRLVSVAEDAIAGGYQPETLASDLFAIELPLTLAYLFPEAKPLRRLGASATESLQDSLMERLDGACLPAAADIPQLRAWLATWTRSMHLATAGDAKLAKKAMEQFDWLVRQCLRLMRSDHSQVLWPLDVKPGEGTRSMLANALKLTEDPEDKALVALIMDGEKVRDHRLPAEPGYESEWSGFALLQPDWSPREPRLAIDFSGTRLNCELSVKNKVLSQGEWCVDVRVDGRELDAVSDWESICWQEDDDVDYLELECEWEGGWKLQRQFVFARQDYFLFIGDALFGPREADLEICQRLPLVDGVDCEPAEESTECFLTRGGKKALVIPPALSEWRRGRHAGELSPTQHGLEQRLAHRGSALYVPLFLD